MVFTNELVITIPFSQKLMKLLDIACCRLLMPVHRGELTIKTFANIPRRVGS